MALRGDLADASPAELITTLADQQATGCLAVDRATRTATREGSDDGQATFHLRNGGVYAAALNGGTFLVGTRLVASHALDAPALAEALEAQRNDLTGWRLGEILVHLGHVHADVIEKISLEQVLEISTEVFGWRSGSWKFRSGERTRAMLPHPLTAADLVQRVQTRGAEWRELQRGAGGRQTPVVRTSATVPLDSSRELVSLLRAVDEHPGDAGLEACSRAAGLSLLEGARLAVSARAVGLLAPLPVEERLAVGEQLGAGDWSGPGRQTQTRTGVTTPSSAGLTLALPPAAGPGAYRSYALAMLLELEGPQPAHDEPAAVVESTPEQIAADLQPEPFEDTGQDATVLDLVAARAARSAELAAIEEAATASALADQLAREQLARESEERAVADALRQATEARAAADAAERRQRMAAAVEAATREATEIAVTAPQAPATDSVTEPIEAAATAATAESPELPDVRPPAFTTAPAAPAATSATSATSAFPTEEPPTPLTAGERLGMFSTTRDPLADTASLLRELSSLGDEEDAPSENRPAVRPVANPATPQQPKAQDKKRKGFFGR